MKPAAFEYEAPATLHDAVGLLASDPEAMVIAGGQSLMPLLALRLATPSLLIDLRRIAGLDGITIDDSGIRLGARVRWCDIMAERQLDTAHPLLRAAVAQVAHYQIRNRGTVGGSLAHADPAAELPGIAVCCEAAITLIGPAGTRIVPAGEFFTGPLSTVRHHDEIVTELHLPAWPGKWRWAYQKFARRQGDFALAGIALFYDEDQDRRAVAAHAAAIGAGDRPMRLPAVEELLNGNPIDDAAIRAAAEAAAQTIDPPEDLHAPAAYRRALVATLVERGLREAAQRGDR